MYSLPDYGRMLGQDTRFGAYRRAIERAVEPGHTVIDLGAGPGVFALLAARCGAAPVYALEPDPVVALVPELAAHNGLEVVAVQALSTAFEPERRADVIVSDLRGVLPTFTDHLPSILDARRRLLAPGGRLTPRRDRLWAAPVDAPAARRRHLGGFEVDGLDLAPAAELASHLWTRVELDRGALRAAPGRVADLDYHRLETPDVEASLVFELDGGRLDGVAAWFDAELDGCERFSNAPGSEAIYGQAFFPFRHPLDAVAGDRLTLRFAARHVPGDDYLYRWAGHLERGGETVARFDHSTFHGTAVSARDLAARSPEHRPSLSPRAAVDAAILGLLGDGRSLGEAADALRRRFPEAVDNAHTALRRVSALADRYGEP